MGQVIVFASKELCQGGTFLSMGKVNHNTTHNTFQITETFKLILNEKLFTISYLWAELEETLLGLPAFAFGGLELSLFFPFFFDTFWFSSEELLVGEDQGDKSVHMRLCITTHSVPLNYQKLSLICYKCTTKAGLFTFPINTIFRKRM